jgi:type IV secretory pathway VirB2 component (pilin)
MEGSDTPPPERGHGPNAQHMITHRLIDAASGRPMMVFLRRLFRFIAASGKSLARALFARIGLMLTGASARRLAIMSMVLVGIGVFFAAVGPPWDRSGRLDAIELAVKRIETRFVAPGPSRTEVANPTTLLVAIQFVSAAAERSTPFDTALAVAISMTGEHPKIGPLLDELLVEAVAGVPSTEDLRRDFRAKLADFEKEGLITDIGGNSGQSAFRLSRFLGLGSAEISDEQRAILETVATEVAAQNLGQAVRRLAKLDGRLREGLESWREQAQRRVAVDSVLTELRRAAFIDLIDDTP